MLNPTLFRLVERAFGEGVLLQAPGVPMEPKYRSTLVDGKKRVELKPLVPGEEYRVNCPYCTDTRNRLYINHRWGVRDEKTRTMNLWLAQCWNENCLASFTRQRDLHNRVYGNVQIGPTGIKQPTEEAKQRRTRMGRVRMPGVMWPLVDMMKTTPNHPAIEYLQGRLIDPLYIGEVYNVSYCLDSWNDFVSNRIVAPFYRSGKLVGWQARYLGKPPTKNIPKWYTCPGMSTGAVFYNGDRALRHQTKVVVEGPGDVWGFGPQACAVMKKTMSIEQRQMLTRSFNTGDVVAILLDPLQDAKSKARGEEHHIDRLYRELNQGVMRDRVVKVYLPPELDPGESDRDYMRDMIRYEADKKGLQVDFGRPAAV